MASSEDACIICQKELRTDQDYTTLTCHATGGETNSHTTHAHDKCWEKFKKTFIRGRGTSSRSQTFFCPVSGCHNALDHQHTSARKKTESGPKREIRAEGSTDASEYATLESARGRGLLAKGVL